MSSVHKSELKKGVDFIGVTCVFYCHDNQGRLLMHKRSKNCRDEQGNWDVGGGSLEFGEEFEQGVKREIMEEYCCEVKKLKYIQTINVIRQNNGTQTHWIALLFTALVDPKSVKIGEPDAMDEIGWFTEDSLPSPLHSKFLNHYDVVKKHIKKEIK